jgi:hypothetical protein
MMESTPVFQGNRKRGSSGWSRGGEGFSWSFETKSRRYQLGNFSIKEGPLSEVAKRQRSLYMGSGLDMLAWRALVFKSRRTVSPVDSITKTCSIGRSTGITWKF